MLITTRFADTAQVHQVKIPGGARTQLTFFPDRVGRPSTNRSTASPFLFTKDIGGGEFFQIYRYDFATGDITLLTDGKSRNTDPRWSYQGDRIAYGSTKRTGNDVDVWVVNATDPSSARMISADGRRRVERFRLVAGRQAIAGDKLRIGGGELCVAGGDRFREKGVAYSEGGRNGGLQQCARFSKDGKGVYMTSDQDAEFQRLVYMDLSSRKATVLTPALNWDVARFDLSKDGRWIAFIANEDGITFCTCSIPRPTKKFLCRSCRWE
jgi:Tol biopolymer transport system component